MYSSYDIAKKILSLAKAEGVGVDPMKLLKLVYITHGWHLGFYSKSLIEETVQAWKYGPVIPDLYHTLKPYGSEDVKYDLIDLFSGKELSEDDDKFVQIIWKNYKNKSGLDLSSLTHQKGTPWDTVFKHGIPGIPIPNTVIEQHYKDKIEKAKSDKLKSDSNV